MIKIFKNRLLQANAIACSYICFQLSIAIVHKPLGLEVIWWALII